MRELKFRGWNSKDKTMEMPSSFGGDIELVDYIEGMLCHNNDVIMQYTGLKDINGKDIYEGDIVRVTVNPNFSTRDRTKSKAVVKWLDRYAGFYICEEGGVSWSFTPDIEVLGNIYENSL